MKLQVSLDEELVGRIDNCAENMYMSRSGFISMACVQYLNQNEFISSFNRVSNACKLVAEKGEVDDEIKKQFEDFERVCELINPK